jgi:hypothetical protein
MATEAIRNRVTHFDTTLLTRLHDDNFQLHHPNPVFYLQDDPDAVDPAADNIPADAEYGDMNQPAKLEADDIEFDSFDKYLNAEFGVNRDGETAIAKVIKRAKDNTGNPIGKRHSNPLLDTREYECELEDGTLMRYNANVIAENIFAQCDDAGRRQAILDEIIDHKRDGRALRADNGYVSVIHMDAALKDELGAVKPKDLGTGAGTGMIGEGRRFESGQGIDCGKNITTFPFGDSPFTAEAWFRSESADSYIFYYGRYATRRWPRWLPACRPRPLRRRRRRPRARGR